MNYKKLKVIGYKIVRFLFSNTIMEFYNNIDNRNVVKSHDSLNIVIVDKINMTTDFEFISEYTKFEVYNELNSGAKLYLVVTDDNCVVHFTCLSSKRRRIGEICSYITPPESCLYIYHCFTELDYRGLGCFSKVLREIVESQNIGSCFICCLKENTISSSVIRKSGFEVIFSVRYVKVFGVSFYFSSDNNQYKKLIG